MRTAIALVMLALLVTAVACASKEPVAPTTPPVAAQEPIVDTFDDGLADTTVDEDLGDLESLDADLAAFE